MDNKMGDFFIFMSASSSIIPLRFRIHISIYDVIQ